MTVALEAEEVRAKLDSKLSGSVTGLNQETLLVEADALAALLAYLKDAAGLEFDYLVDITAVDYWDYFELVYQLVSIKHNHKITVKTRLPGRENLTVPSIVGLYKGADYQEREIHDLLGIGFTGRPNLKPIALWEGFKGYPLRRDYL
jgi:NADH-quinone oxidoreductase subunit C